MVSSYSQIIASSLFAPLAYGTAHVQVYKQMRVTRHASRNFEDNLRVGLMRHKEYTARERLLMS